MAGLAECHRMFHALFQTADLEVFGPRVGRVSAVRGPDLGGVRADGAGCPLAAYPP